MLEKKMFLHYFLAKKVRFFPMFRKQSRTTEIQRQKSDFLWPKFKSQSQITIWDMNIKAQKFLISMKKGFIGRL